LGSLTATVARNLWLDESGLAEHLKPGMGSLLFALFREDGRRLVDVAAELRIAKSTMTGMVSRMCDAGLIRLEDDADDGRSWRMWLTPQARKLEPKCQRLAVEMETLLGAKLTVAEQAALRRALVLVTHTIAEQLESRPPMSESARSKTKRRGGARKGTRAGAPPAGGQRVRKRPAKAIGSK
jgi:DNA-binding MarR family transcriptional regulator